MATAENKNEDRLWNSSVLSSKSWVEIMENEEREQESANKGISPLRRSFLNEQNSSVRLCNGVNIKSEIKIEPLEDEAAQDLGLGTHTDPNKLPAVDGLPTFGKTLSSNSLPKTPLKKEPTEVFQEDISLTGHLDGFKLVSPCKVDEKPQNDNNTFKTPEKCAPNRLKTANCSSEGDVKHMGSCKRKLPGVKTDDAALMPSPNKISRISAASTPPNTVATRKRLRDNLTPTPKRSPTKKKREPETDPDVLARRQKQIDYGKNTIGYERYRQLVPKESRTKMHPRTPPLNLKFSRRAWDGLVKVWRQRLHFWDPPSEGGGNPECLEIQSEMSDCSSTDGSLPNTPVQEWKRQKSSLPGLSPCLLKTKDMTSKNLSIQTPKRKLTSSVTVTKGESGEKYQTGNTELNETTEEFLSQGCTPLPD